MTERQKRNQLPIACPYHGSEQVNSKGECTSCVKQFDPIEFGKAVRERRGEDSPHKTCEEVGTVLRILREVEAGSITSITTFAQFCRWMGTSADAWLHLDEFEEA